MGHSHVVGRRRPTSRCPSVGSQSERVLPYERESVGRDFRVGAHHAALGSWGNELAHNRGAADNNGSSKVQWPPGLPGQGADRLLTHDQQGSDGA